nr:MAG TPA: hypothetical protein [Caudoviricetes sp.]
MQSLHHCHSTEANTSRGRLGWAITFRDVLPNNVSSF